MIKNITNKLIAIIGPTASGKTDIAIKLAKQFNGEIICADSRTVYKGMDLGTAKPFLGYNYKVNSSKFGPVYNIDGVNHYMIDVCDPKIIYTVAEFAKSVKIIINDIFSRGKTPFLVGGSGLYIDAVLQNFQFPGYNSKLRSTLELKSESDLFEELMKVDPVSAKKFEKNKRRLVRALEVYLLTKKPIGAYRKENTGFQSLVLAIDWPREELYKRIDDRVDARIKLGMIEEIENLHVTGLSWDRLESFGLEYRYISDYLKSQKSTCLAVRREVKSQKENDLIKQEMIQVLKYKIHSFARRQLTWFRRNDKIIWVNDIKKAQKHIKSFLC